MGELNDWAKKQSKAIVLDDGETFVAVYRGYKISTNPFDTEKEIVVYRLEFVQDGQNVVKGFRSTSGKAARFFDKIEDGEKISIRREGIGTETKYQFETFRPDAPAAADQEPPDDTDVPF